MRNKKLIILFSILTFVTLITVLGSVVFSVQHVYAYCYNIEDEAYDAQVAGKDINGISRGRSIFLLNEKKTIDTVQQNLSDARVINIERKFPNTVYINYVRVFSYLAYESEGETLYVSNDCKILSKGEKLDNYPDHIRVIALSETTGTAAGELLFAANTANYTFIHDLMRAIEQIRLHRVIVDLFEFIDLSRTAESGVTFIKTRTGVMIELQGGTRNVLDKINLALSLYYSFDGKYLSSGTIIVEASGKTVTHSPSSRY